VTASQVLADAFEQLVIVEQAVELLQLGIEAEVELGDQREQIGPFVSIPEHGSGLPSVRVTRFRGVVPAYQKPRIPPISHRKLVLLSSFLE
jgi:hypothetical protein